MRIVIRFLAPLLPLILTATLVWSCSGDKENPQPPLPELSVEEDDYPTASDGTIYNIPVTAKNVEDWDFKTQDVWLKCLRPDGGNVLRVTVEPNESTDERTGTITIFAAGAEDLTLTIIQQGNKPPVDAKIIWDNNHRFFAKLLGPVASANFVEDMSAVKLVEFDKDGYVKRITTEIQSQTGTGNLLTTYEYDSQKRLTRIEFFNASGQGIGMSVVVNYTSEHNNYVDIGHSFLGGLEFVTAMQPRFVKGVSSVVTTDLASGAYEIKYLFTGNELRVEDNRGYLLGIGTYGQDGFPESQTNYLSTTQGGIAYNVDFTETYDMDSESGKFKSIVYIEEWMPVNQADGQGWTTDAFTETYLDDKYNNKHMEGSSVEFTYDEYGEFLVITSPVATDSYTYTRDSWKNWTTRVDNSVYMGGEPFVITDKRTVKYYVQ